MNALLAVLALAIGIGIILLVPTHGAPAVLVCVALAAPAGFIISRAGGEGPFLLRLFSGGLLVRILIGTGIFVFQLQEFFGGDAFQYDDLGYMLLRIWQGETYLDATIDNWYAGGGWGMLYLVAAVYGAVGRNMLAVQFVNAVIGAATAPIVFLCARQMFLNIKVARIAGFFAAFFPSLVLWSSQALKDGPIVFLLVVTMLATLKLSERFSVKYVTVLICALFGILTLRFYVFYMVLGAITGTFVIGMGKVSGQVLVRQVMVIICMGFTLTYLGVLRTGSAQFETYGTLERVQYSRVAHTSAQSGFGKDVDISTTRGAISAIPIGLVYLLFAPFPWQLTSLRQIITMPEMLIWWASFPMLILGLWFTVKYRLRQALPVILFSIMLTLAYSLFQGNVGTAYRQRSQVLVFYFIFIAVGFVLLKEKSEERRQRALADRRAHSTVLARRSPSKV